jgi:hypothetical protein
MPCNTPAGAALIADPTRTDDPNDPGSCHPRPDNYRGNWQSGSNSTVTHNTSVTGDGGAPGSGADYDQGVGVDSITNPPANRIHPTFGTVGYTGGIPFFCYGTAHPDAAVDFLNTSIDGTLLNPASHSEWDGTIVPALSSPVDEYINLTGPSGGSVSLRSHGNIGLADAPGMHAHLVAAHAASVNPNNQHWGRSIVKNVESIDARNVASAITTMSTGVPVACPSITAPDRNCMMFWLVHIVPQVGGAGVITEFDHVNDVGWLTTPSWTQGSTADAGKWGGVQTFHWQPWEAGTYTPEIEIIAGDSPREVAISGFLATFRRDGGE